MGENTPNRPARLLAALTTVAAAGALLTSCASLAGAGSAADPTEAAPAVASSAPASAPVESTSAPAPSASASGTTGTDLAAVEPFVTSAAWDGSGLDVGALVPKVVESGGTCTATAVRDGVTVEKSGAAVAASSYTGCPQLVLKDERLVPGTWTVTVSYASDTSAGASAARAVTIG